MDNKPAGLQARVMHTSRDIQYVQTQSRVNNNGFIYAFHNIATKHFCTFCLSISSAGIIYRAQAQIVKSGALGDGKLDFVYMYIQHSGVCTYQLFHGTLIRELDF